MPELVWPSSFTSKVNWIRVSFHVLGGLMIASMMWLFVGTVAVPIAISFCVLAVIVEVLRIKVPTFRQAFESSFGILMKKDEHHGLTGYTWLVAGALIIVLFIKDREPATLAYLVWAVGDATAVVMGTLLGGPAILPGIKKTWAGSLAGLAAVITTAIVMLTIWQTPNIAPTASVLCLVFILTETFSRPLGLDDNLTIPLAVAVALSLF